MSGWRHVMVASLDGGGHRHRQPDRPQHVNVDPQVGTGRFETAVAKQVADRLDADTPTQQSHGKGVAQRIGRHTGQRQTALGSAVLEDLDDSVRIHRLDRAADAQEQLWQVAVGSANLRGNGATVPGSEPPAAGQGSIGSCVGRPSAFLLPNPRASSRRAAISHGRRP